MSVPFEPQAERPRSSRMRSSHASWMGAMGARTSQCSTLYGSISIMKGDMKFQHEQYSMDKNNPRYAEALELFAVDVPDVRVLLGIR